jgi:hypothetical protein
LEIRRSLPTLCDAGGDERAVSDSNQAAEATVPAAKRPALLATLGLLLIVFGTLQLKHLSHPLLWQDEGETAMFGRRVLEYGYPKVSDGRNVVYGMGVPLDVAVAEESDAYIGSLWGQYYFAALGVSLANAAEDPHRQASLVRLPFALAGLGGLLLLFVAFAPLLGRARSGPWPAAIVYLALLSVSTSLILHQREARYYPLVVLLLGAIVCVYQRRLAPGLEGAGPDSRARGGSVWLALLLLVLFNVFYPAAVSLMLWLGVEALWLTWRSEARWRARPARGASIWIPLVIVSVLCIPLALYFEIPQLSRVMSERWSFGAGGYLANLVLILRYLLRFEMLVPVLLVEAALVATRPRGADEDALRRSATSLLRLCAVWILVGARNPIFFERYFVPLSPVLSLILVLDGYLLLGRVRARGGRGRLVLRTAVVVVVAGMSMLRWPELHGRVVEVFVPYRGPVDEIVETLRGRGGDTAALTIATNYEAEPLMFHLDSRVVGRSHAATAEAAAAEAALVPDVVIPRGAQSRRLAEVRRYLVRGGYKRVRRPVADWPYNNVPELFEGGVLVTPHRFRTPLAGEGVPPLILYLRRDLP